MRIGRPLLVLAAAALLLAPTADARSWAHKEIKLAVASGLMGPSVKDFQPDAPLKRAELAQIVAGITKRAQVVVAPDRDVTVAQLDAALVRALGLQPAARNVRVKLAEAGLEPPGRAGTEAIARLLGLRFNHPAGQDALELGPNDPVTRADAAHSVARLLELSEWNLASANERAMALAVPVLTAWEQKVLRRAVRFVGFPYVWGGSSEEKQAPFGTPAPGGFDCSGFVWRVYKLEPFAEAPTLGSTMAGRTTFAMSGEMKRADRVPLAELRPADVVFFGDRGARSKPAQVGHMGIYLGGGWFVHSSSQGTTITPLDGWYESSFAWGRRPLAEAGLS